MSLRTPFLFALGLSSLSCLDVTTRANLDHCTFNEGDRYCAEMFEGLPFCTQGQNECSSKERYGCVAEVAPECHRPCGVLSEEECLGAASSTGTDTGVSSESSSESSESGSESSSTTGPMPCVSDEECTDAAAPFCGVTGECGTCDGTADGDAACAGVDPMAPLCVGDACVACTPENPLVCDEQLLLCDGTTNACVPCVAHDECGSGACELAVGTCFPPGTVVHVDGDGGQDFMTVAAAVASVGAGMHGVVVVHELDGGNPYTGAVLIDGGKRIALLAAAGEDPILQGTGGAAGLTVEGAGTILYMDGLRVAGNTMGLGLRVNGAFAWVDRSRIVQNSGGGVLAENGAELVLRNCFVGRNGDQFADTRGFTATGSSLDVRYTTIAANDGSGGVISLSCDAASTGEVRNSIVAAGDDTIACANVSFSFSVVDTAGLTGSDNDVLSFAPAWFPNIAMSDFHVGMGPPFADVAQWSTGDPLTDIDGDLRPAVDGTPDYAGADVP